MSEDMIEFDQEYQDRANPALMVFVTLVTECAEKLWRVAGVHPEHIAGSIMTAAVRFVYSLPFKNEVDHELYLGEMLTRAIENSVCSHCVEEAREKRKTKVN